MTERVLVIPGPAVPWTRPFRHGGLPKRQESHAMRVRDAWRVAGEPTWPKGEPIELSLMVYVARAKGHFGTGRNAGVLKESAPLYPTSKPDLSNTLKLVEDALTHYAWPDDDQIVGYFEPFRKVYCTAGTEPRSVVRIRSATWKP